MANHKIVLWFTQDGKCYYCGDLLSLDIIEEPTEGSPATIDHFDPRVHGGSNQITNKVVSCSPCNYMKGDQTPEAFIEKCRKVLTNTNISAMISVQ